MCGGTERHPAHAGLTDRLFGAGGTWVLHECLGCGLLYLDPRLARTEIWRAYQSYYTHAGSPDPESVPGPAQPSSPPGLLVRLRRLTWCAYLARAYGYDQGVSRLQRALAYLAYLHPAGVEAAGFSVMYLPYSRNARLLDVGCGSGAFLATMRALGWQVLGVEADPVAADLARRSYGLEVLTGTPEDHLLPSNHFDAITMSHVIEHVHDPVDLLRDCGRLLKPSGRMVVVTPNVRSLGRRRFGAAWLGLDPPRHLHLFSRATLLWAAAQAGLAVVSLRSSVRNADYAWLGGRGLLTRWPAPGERILPASRRWRAQAFQLREVVGTWLGADLGEELVLIAAQRR